MKTVKNVIEVQFPDSEGWRVFQIRKMENAKNHRDFFDPEDFDFDESYP